LAVTERERGVEEGCEERGAEEERGERGAKERDAEEECGERGAEQTGAKERGVEERRDCNIEQNVPQLRNNVNYI
jgi:hypothetical protein